MSDELLGQLVAAHRGVFERIEDAVTDLRADQWTAPTGCPGWDVHDQLAHIVGVERGMLGDAPDEPAGPADPPHVRSEFGRRIEAAVAARRGRAHDALLAEAVETFGRRLEVLGAMDPEALGRPLDGPAGLRMKGSQMLRTRVFDLVTHEHDIRRTLGRVRHATGPDIDIAVEQVLRAWARLLPTRHGPTGVLQVRVDERPPVGIDFQTGELRRGGVQLPTASVALELAALLALAGGRSDAPEPSEVDLDGELAWARGVLADCVITP